MPPRIQNQNINFLTYSNINPTINLHLKPKPAHKSEQQIFFIEVSFLDTYNRFNYSRIMNF